MNFTYGKEEIDYLKSVDKNMADLIDKIGMINREINPNVFECLIFQIVGQQISNKAYATIKKRVSDLLENITPDTILACNDDDLQKCGMSFRKVEYMKNIASFWQSDAIDFDNIHTLSDEDIIENLTKVKGVGTWTVEMLLIFSLQRKNVLSYNDLIIKNNLMKLHNIDKIDKKSFDQYKKLYSPYASIASLYLWEMSH